MKKKHKEFFSTIEISIIVAVANNGVIGTNNRLPWKLKGELKHFKETTMGHVLAVGRKTYESMPPLKGRSVSVVSSNFMKHSSKDPSVAWCPDLPSAIYAPALYEKDYKKCFIAGGSSIYEEAIRLNLVDKMIVTHVKGSFDGDAYFNIPGGWQVDEILKETNEYTIKVWKKYESNK